MGEGGEIFILDMGEPVRIVDLAADMITLSGLQADEDIEIVFTGLRPGEKLFEELELTGEQIAKTKHPKIYVGKLQAYPPDDGRAGPALSGGSVARRRWNRRAQVPRTRCSRRPISACAAPRASRPARPRAQRGRRRSRRPSPEPKEARLFLGFVFRNAPWVHPISSLECPERDEGNHSRFTKTSRGRSSTCTSGARSRGESCGAPS